MVLVYCMGGVGVEFIVLFFFFKQRTAYEMLGSLVGSEMCIRDSPKMAGKMPGDMAGNWSS